MLKLPDPQFWDVFKKTPGALSATESLAIIQLSMLAPSGTYICLGSHKGKDSLSAVRSLKKGRFYLVDPIYEDENLAKQVSELVSLYSINNVEVRTIPSYSVDVLSSETMPKKYEYIFWDSGEHGGTVLEQETALLENMVADGGIIVSHDIGNQFTQQTLAMQKLVNTGKFEWIPIDWQPIFDYVKEHDLENGNNSWHLYPELPHPPNFIGALRKL